MNINSTEYITVTDHLRDIAELKKQQPPLNIEKAAEEIYNRVPTQIPRLGSVPSVEILKQILTRHFTKTQPSQPTDEQIEEIADVDTNDKPVKRGSTLYLYPNSDLNREPMTIKVPDKIKYCWYLSIDDAKQAILSALALRK